MPYGIKNKGLLAQPVAESTASLLTGPTTTINPRNAPDAGLSAAFAHALGGRPAEAHLPGTSQKRGQEIAKLARSDKPAAVPKGGPRKPHIGPRSGHK